MLSDERKELIHLEEIFRDETRKEIQRSSPEDSPLLKLFNQPIVLWFLSTAVVGMLTFSYNIMSQETKANKQKQARTLDLDLEFASRIRTLDNFFTYSSSIDENDNFTPIFISMISDIGVFQLQGQQNAKTTSQKRTLASLLWELEELVSVEEKEDVIKALSITESLNELSIQGTLQSFNSLMPGELTIDIDSMKVLAKMLVNIERWKVLTANNINLKKRQAEVWKELESKLKVIKNKKKSEQEVKNRIYEEARAKEELSDKEKMDLAKQSLLLIKKIGKNWLVKENKDPQGNRVHLKVVLSNNSKQTIEHLVANIDVFNLDLSPVVSTGDVKYYGRVAPGEEFIISDRMDTGWRPRSLTNYSIDDFNSMKIVVFPTEVVYEGGEIKKYDSISNVNLIELYEDFIFKASNNAVN